jgi:hypothetical protein
MLATSRKSRNLRLNTKLDFVLQAGYEGQSPVHLQDSPSSMKGFSPVHLQDIVLRESQLGTGSYLP